MSLQYIRNAYQVPASRGTKVRFTPDSRDKPMVGRVLSAHNALVVCRFEGSEKRWNCHPVWQMEYFTPDGWWSPERRSFQPTEPRP